MTKHEIVNKLSAVYAHLRTADTHCANNTVIDHIRQATGIVLDMGDKLGVTLRDNREEI